MCKCTMYENYHCTSMYCTSTRTYVHTRMYGTRTPYALSTKPYPYVQIPLLVVWVKDTVHKRTDYKTLSVNQWEGNAGKMENTNTQIRELYLSRCMQQKFHVMWFLLEIPIC